MNLIKKHVDTVIVLGGILAAVLWMNSSITNLDNEIVSLKLEISDVKKDLAIVKTVMIMQGHMPKELAKQIEEIK